MHGDLVTSRIVSRIVEHVPQNYASAFARFLMLPNHSIRCRVTRQRVNRGAGFGLEVPADYIFYGNAKAIGWLSARIASVDKELNKKVIRSLKYYFSCTK